MITLLSAIFGFVSSMAPDILGMFKDKADKKHELAMLGRQAELGLQQSKEERATAELVADGEELKALIDAYKTELQNSDKSMVARLSASVRPVLTYAFFALYAGMKISQLVLIMNPTLPWQSAGGLAQAFVAVWTEEDMALFSAIIAFWFGTRQLRSWRNSQR